VLPRHLQIIYDINHRFLKDVMHHYPGDPALWQRMSLIDESAGRRIRMAHLAIVGSHKVNGVAAIHTRLMKETIFADFHRLWPDKIVNMTNGVTPRRWLNQANPALAHLITAASARAGSRTSTSCAATGAAGRRCRLPRRSSCASSATTSCAWRTSIRSGWAWRLIPPAMFDVQIKRIHEYKRQLLNLLHVITLYNRLRAGADAAPRTVVFGGKAAPGYRMAKLIIRLINDVADIVNNDPWQCATGSRWPSSPTTTCLERRDHHPRRRPLGADLDCRHRGLGHRQHEAGAQRRADHRHPGRRQRRDPQRGRARKHLHLRPDHRRSRRAAGHGLQALAVLRRQPRAEAGAGHDPRRLSSRPEERERYKPVFDNLTANGDHYLLLADYASYIAAQDRAGALYRDQDAWTRKAILNVAGMGQFSSDRTIGEYAKTIWNVEARPRSL
jgi:starch phosphorylase